jgi:hypothetical protein
MSKLTMQPLRNVLFPIGLIAIVAVLIMIVVGLSFKGIVQATLQNEAERKAVLWAQEFMVLVPDHRILADTEEASAAQFEIIRTALGGEGIFRFNFFSPAGELIYTSDDGRFFCAWRNYS